MLIIIDTNILVKYALSDERAVSLLDYLSINHQFAVTKPILSEYKLILSRPKLKLPAEIQRATINIIKNNSILFEDSFFRFNKDREDEKFFACAAISDADYLITNDNAFANAQWKVKTKIIDLDEAMKLINVDSQFY